MRTPEGKWRFLRRIDRNGGVVLDGKGVLSSLVDKDSISLSLIQIVFSLTWVEVHNLKFHYPRNFGFYLSSQRTP